MSEIIREGPQALRCPPTGSLGFGPDRMIMPMTDSATIRDVLFFYTMKPWHKECWNCRDFEACCRFLSDISSDLIGIFVDIRAGSEM